VLLVFLGLFVPSFARVTSTKTWGLICADVGEGTEGLPPLLGLPFPSLKAITWILWFTKDNMRRHD
jgi:hypothetical protein